jgi:hypothetical protein
MIIPPDPLRSHVLEFVDETWITAAGDIGFVAKFLPPIRDLRVHAKIFPKIDINLLAQASLKYLDKSMRGDRIWMSDFRFQKLLALRRNLKLGERVPLCQRRPSEVCWRSSS